MGPSVKFVSAIIDAFSNKKMGVNFFSPIKDQTGGGGSEGGLAKDQTFSGFFFGNLPLDDNKLASSKMRKLTSLQSQEAYKFTS